MRYIEMNGEDLKDHLSFPHPVYRKDFFKERKNFFDRDYTIFCPHFKCVIYYDGKLIGDFNIKKLEAVYKYEYRGLIRVLIDDDRLQFLYNCGHIRKDKIRFKFKNTVAKYLELVDFEIYGEDGFEIIVDFNIMER